MLAVAIAMVLVARDGRHEVDTGTVDVPRASPADAAAALASFVAAVRSRDAADLAGLAPAEDAEAAELLTGLAANARSLDLRAVTARYVDQAGAVAADGSWSGVAEMTWRVGRFDRAPARADVVVSFAPEDEGLAITGFDGSSAASRLPLWLRGALSVARSGDDTLVMVDGAQRDADSVAARVRRGTAVVRRVLPGWSGPVVVEVPASAADLDETLGAQPGTYAAIAAVTAPVGEARDRDAPVHVFVNPEVTDGLRRAGAQVVMSHELVHVATDAVRTPVEPWLLEGFADYVALRDTRLPDRVTLGRAIAAARRSGVPEELPTAADFDTRAADLQARYEEAWLACRIIAERLGERRLVEMYHQASSGTPVGAALIAVGLPRRELVALWRVRLEQSVR